MSDTAMGAALMVVVGLWEWGFLTLVLWLEDEAGQPLVITPRELALFWMAWPIAVVFARWYGTMERTDHGIRIRIRRRPGKTHPQKESAVAASDCGVSDGAMRELPG